MRTASEKLLRKKDKKDEPYTEILCVILSNEGKKTQYGNIERTKNELAFFNKFDLYLVFTLALPRFVLFLPSCGA